MTGRRPTIPRGLRPIAGLLCLVVPALLPSPSSAQPANDECSGAIPAVEGANPIDTTLATDSSNPPYDEQPCPFSGLGFVAKDLWYSYTPASDGLLTVTTCGIPDWDSDIVLYSGGCLGPGQIACSGDSFLCPEVISAWIADVPVSAGEEIRIRIGSWAPGESGVGSFQVGFVSASPEAGACTDGVDNDLDGLIDCDDPECAGDPACTAGNFVRGDANQGGGSIGLGDAVFILQFLFLGGPMDCMRAADANDDGGVNLSDPVNLLSFLFLGGPPPLAPFPGCGADPTPDPLTCDRYENPQMCP